MSRGPEYREPLPQSCSQVGHVLAVEEEARKLHGRSRPDQPVDGKRLRWGGTRGNVRPGDVETRRDLDTARLAELVEELEAAFPAGP